MKKRKNGAALLPLVIYILIGGVCGFLCAAYGKDFAALLGVNYGIAMLYLLLCLVLAVWAQIVIHEAGHLIAGLACGYRFLSFRVGSILLAKEENGFRIGRMSLAGTAGQCLMAPPDGDFDSVPVTLYNLGGPLINLVSAPLFAVLGLVGLPAPVACFGWMAGAVGIGFFLTNGIPFGMGNVDNDGRNAILTRRDPAARRAFVIQLRTASEIAQGKRLRDLPEAWFEPVAGSDCILTAAIDAFACNRLMDAGRLDEAASAIDSFLHTRQNAGLYAHLLRADRLCLAALRGETALRDRLLDKSLQKFMEAMKDFPSVLRTGYILALWDGDEKNAASLKARFERMAAKYPYAGEMEGERELMRSAEEKFSGA